MKNLGNKDWPRCDCCGKFIKSKDLLKGGGGSWKFVLYSDVSYEEHAYRCRACTDTFGKTYPIQNVVEHMCCGIY